MLRVLLVGALGPDPKGAESSPALTLGPWPEQKM
jgi:hypothetical protein